MIARTVVAIVFIGLNLYVFRYYATGEYIPERETFASFPLQLGEWQCDEQGDLPDNVIANLGVTDYLLCDFHNEETGGVANVYVGYHASQSRSVAGQETLIHPPEHCLPGGGWDIIQSEIVETDWAPGGEAKRVVIAKGNMRNLVYFWYQSRGRVIARNHEKVLYLFLDRATERRTDGSLVRLTVPIVHGREDEAERTIRELVDLVTPLLPEYVPN